MVADLVKKVPVLATGAYPEPDGCSPLPTTSLHYSSFRYFYICVFKFSKWFLIRFLTSGCYMPCQSCALSLV
jgi:hypothetical protein